MLTQSRPREKIRMQHTNTMISQQSQHLRANCRQRAFSPSPRLWQRIRGRGGRGFSPATPFLVPRGLPLPCPNRAGCSPRPWTEAVRLEQVLRAALALPSWIALGSLNPDPEPRRGGISKALTVTENVLHVQWKADEARILRVSVGSFLDHLSLVVETMDLFGHAVA